MKFPEGSKVTERIYAKCILDFEYRIKVEFKNNGQKWAVDLGVGAEFSDAGIEDGHLIFTNEEILGCFEPVVNRIIDLIKNQIDRISGQMKPLKVTVAVCF